jgi:hypothetical protein
LKGFLIKCSFQQVQELPALQSSIRYFSQIVMGTSTNIVLVYLIPRVPVLTLTAVSACITLISPALMATVTVNESYWLAPFWALFLCPVNPWGESTRHRFRWRPILKLTLSLVIFSISNLLISDAFPAEIQSVAGSVFNSLAQFGNSVGLAVTATIAASVTEHSPDKGSKAALMEGFRAAFWTIFASTATVLVICLVGLRKTGTIGKNEQQTREEVLEGESCAV